MEAMRKMNKISTSSIARPKKVRIYKAYVQSIMLFGCSTWLMCKKMERSIDSLNRRMVKHACEIFWPKRMSTKEINALIEIATCEVKKTTLADAKPHFSYGRPFFGIKSNH